MQFSGLHHLTAISADIKANRAFYTGVLGLRLVKKSINQDDVKAYHLYYADGRGQPGQRRHLLRLATRTGTARNRQHQPHRLAGGRCRQPVMVARASFPRRRVGRRDRGA